MRPTRAAVLVLAAALGLTACDGGDDTPPSTSPDTQRLSGEWRVPWAVEFAPDGTFALVTERDTGEVWRVDADGSGKTAVGEVPGTEPDGEGGLMGVAFAPEWDGDAETGVFVMHTTATDNRIARLDFDGQTLDGYEPILTDIAKNSFHNGGRIGFGPDGYLYATTGDAGDEDLSQQRKSLSGKILRVTAEGEPAPDNPFDNEVYSYGHRNPQGLAWDDDGRLWAAEFGQNSWDELNLIEPGANYGWPVCEGECDENGMTNPKRTWATPDASPSGLAYVDGALYMASLRGERMWRIGLDGANVDDVKPLWEGDFGRLRAVTRVPDDAALWFGTSNHDGRGDTDEPDRLYRYDVG